MIFSSFKRVVFILLLQSVCAYSFGQDNSINIITTAVPFLRISPDARAGGMGDVGIATTPDGNSGFWNLAKTPFAKANTSASFTYTPWLKDLGLNDVYLLCASGYHKIDELNVVSLSMRYFNLGNIQFTGENGETLNSANPKEFGLDLGYARKLGEKLALGVSLRYINSNLISGSIPGDPVVYKAGKTVAGDISLFKNAPYENGSGLSWGINISNLGGKIGYTSDALKKDYIPANLGIGLAYTIVPDEANKITFALDMNKLLVPTPPTATDPTDATADSTNLADYRNKSVVSSWFSSFTDGGGTGNQFKKLQFSLGAEYVYNDQFALRAGYFYEDVSQGNRKYLTFGAGLKYNVMGINISYLVPSGNGITRNPLSNTLRFGLTFDLDGGLSGNSPSSLSEPGN